jgi:hypothetical protein
MIITNDGCTNYFNPHADKSQIQSIKWDNKGITNPDSKNLQIFKVFIIDKNNKFVEIYDNLNVKILNSYHKNYGKEV